MPIFNERDQMTLTKEHEYKDTEGDHVKVHSALNAGDTAFVEAHADGVYVHSEFAAPLALNILGHDRPDDDPLATKFEVEGQGAFIASSPAVRNQQLNLAAAILMAVDGYDRRAVRLATAESRRNEAAKRLTDHVVALRRTGAGDFTGDEIGKLREALGKYDAALAN